MGWDAIEREAAERRGSERMSDRAVRALCEACRRSFLLLASPGRKLPGLLRHDGHGAVRLVPCCKRCEEALGPSEVTE